MRPVSAHRSPAHASAADLEAGIDFVRESPADAGTLELIVGRPVENQRELVEEGRLDQAVGLVGDSWAVRPSSSTADGGPNPEAQVTVMNARAAALMALGSHPLRWAQAGDQLYVDFDRRPAPGLWQVWPPLRHRGAEVRQLPSRSCVATARPQRPCVRAGHHSPQRRGAKALSVEV